MGVDIMKYCNSCNQNVSPSRKFSIVWFLINCLWLIGGIVYIIYYFTKPKVCPICHGNQLEASRENIIIDGDIANVTTKEAKQDRFEQNMKNSAIKQKEYREILLDKRVVLKEKNVIAKEKFAAARQKVKDESAARVLARQQRKLNKNI